MLLAVCACAEGISCCSCAAAYPQSCLRSGRPRTATDRLLCPPPPPPLPSHPPLPLPLPLAQAIKLVVKVLSKTMDSTTLSPDKVELATLSRDEDAGQVRAHQLASPVLWRAGE